MEEEISTFVYIIVSDPQLKQDFLMCLNQYVLNGNKSRYLAMEKQIQIKLAEYVFNDKIKKTIYDESFFEKIYNSTKHILSKEYVVERILNVQSILQNYLTSIAQFLSDIQNFSQPSDVIPNSTKIIQFCDEIIEINNPFSNNSPKRNKKLREIKSLLDEIDKSIEIKQNNYNYKIQCDASFVLSVISEGLNFATVERFLAKNNISTCSKKNFI